MKTKTITGEHLAGAANSDSLRPGTKLRVIPIGVADAAATLVWVAKLLGWFVLSGCVASGSATTGVPAPSDWPPRPHRIRWRRATDTLLAEIEESLS
jgi:hypothetical protein